MAEVQHAKVDAGRMASRMWPFVHWTVGHTPRTIETPRPPARTFAHTYTFARPTFAITTTHHLRETERQTDREPPPLCHNHIHLPFAPVYV